MKNPLQRSTRRTFLGTTAAGFLVLPTATLAEEEKPKKTHLLTLSFDDGFRKSSIRTAKF